MEPLRSLILEDNAPDADLVQFELAESGLTFTAKVVVTKKTSFMNSRNFLPT